MPQPVHTIDRRTLAAQSTSDSGVTVMSAAGACRSHGHISKLGSAYFPKICKIFTSSYFAYFLAYFLAYFPAYFPASAYFLAYSPAYLTYFLAYFLHICQIIAYLFDPVPVPGQF